jgi:8-oxo-dGTP pyrophosphatase MutT (NUDIX family)
LISAAGIMFLTDKGETLLLKRSASGDWAGSWCFPGGKIEKGESAEDAAKRECEEEIGSLPEGSCQLWTRRISDDGEGKVDFSTFIQRIEKSFEPKLDHEHTDFAWIHVFDITNPKSNEPESGPEIMR